MLASNRLGNGYIMISIPVFIDLFPNVRNIRYIDTANLGVLKYFTIKRKKNIIRTMYKFFISFAYQNHSNLAPSKNGTENPISH